MKKFIVLFILLAVATIFCGCNKEDSNKTEPMNLVVDFSIANVGDVVNFTVQNPIEGYTGVRWDMGDGSQPQNGGTNRNYNYSAAGNYTVTATVFHNNESTQLTVDITIEGTGGGEEPDTNGTDPGLRLTGIEVLEMQYGVGDIDLYNSQFDTNYLSDPYFEIIYYSPSGIPTVFYFPSSTKYNTDTPKWVLTNNEIPVFHYNTINYSRIEINFYDDDSHDNNGPNSFLGNISINRTQINSYLGVKPTQLQITNEINSNQETIVNLTLEWVD